MTTSAGAAQPTDTLVNNMALAHVGSVKFIQNLDSDASAEAIISRSFYYSTRDEVLRAFPWGFATKFATLQLVQTAPTSEWAFSYRYPSDCLLFRRICSGLRTDNRQSRVSFKIGKDSQGQLILTDWQNAVQSTTGNPVLVPDCEYTFQAYDTQYWPSDFIQALSWKQAFYIAPAFFKGDPFQLRTFAEQQYEKALSEARAANANEEQPDMVPDSEFVRARDGILTNPYSDQTYKSFPGGFQAL